MIITKENTFEFIPDGWEVKTMGEIGTFSKGKGLSASDYDEKGKQCILYGDIYVNFDTHFAKSINRANLKACEKSVFCKKNDLLFTCSGETSIEIGKAVVYLGNEPLYVGGDIAIFTPDKDNDGLFLSYQQNSFPLIKQKARYGQGFSVVHIYSEMLKKLYILMPPIREQIKIARIIESVDKCIENKKIIIENETKLFNILLEKLYSHNCDEMIKIKDIIIKNKSILIDKTDKYLEIGDINVINGNYNLKTTKKPVDGSKACLNNTILISTVRPGRGAVTISKEEMYVSSALAQISINTENDLKYYYYLFRTKRFLKSMVRLSTGSTYPTIVKSDILNFKFEKKTLEQQKEISRILDLYNSKIILLETELILLKKQKKGLMQQLLTGLIRVNVDEQ